MPHPSNRLNAVRLVKGQTKVLAIAVKSSDGRPIKLDTAKLYFSVSKGPGEPVLVAKTTDDGIKVTDAAKGNAEVTLSSSDTAALVAGQYSYDIWVEFDGDPPVRQPVVPHADLHVADAVTTFSG